MNVNERLILTIPSLWICTNYLQFVAWSRAKIPLIQSNIIESKHLKVTDTSLVWEAVSNVEREKLDTRFNFMYPKSITDVSFQNN